MTINSGRVGICHEEIPSIKSPDPLIKWSCKVMQILLAALFTTATKPMAKKPMATKLGKVVTYYKKLQPIKLHTL